ncbi:LuxR C-terminal-related transcriptional regulator [Streptomyces sp. NPDC088350]|uniref:helix-turn-helix transcriptional regulator n=1 Tax=Streptomyces sp. NPDC088350 TaxID=3365854 RepID=UPI0038112086
MSDHENNRPPEPLDALTAASTELLRRVPADVWCAVMLDPATLLDTGGLHEHGFPAELMPRLFEIEHGIQEGTDHIRALAARPGTTSLLSRSTHGPHTDSVYYRDILAPAGLTDELRVTLKAAGHTWGLLVLCRGPRSRPFTPDDVRRAAAVSAPAAAGLRRALLLTGIDSPGAPAAPGLVVTDRGGRISSVSPTAAHWLGQLAEKHRTGEKSPPYALSAVLQQVRHAPAGSMISARVRTRAGRWITVSAWRQGPPGEELAYAALTPSQPGELAALVLDTYGLTQRERDVTQQVLRGSSGAEISGALHISEYTVQDHLRKVFDKIGVRSRRELTGTLFLRHYLPVLPHPPLTTDGRLLDGKATDQEK